MWNRRHPVMWWCGGQMCWWTKINHFLREKKRRKNESWCENISCLVGWGWRWWSCFERLLQPEGWAASFPPNTSSLRRVNPRRTRSGPEVRFTFQSSNIQVRVTVRYWEKSFSICALPASVRTALSSAEGPRAVWTHAVVLQPAKRKEQRLKSGEEVYGLYPNVSKIRSNAKSGKLKK